MVFTLEQIVKATAGTIVQGSLKKKIRGVSTHSKKVRPGELFIAICGERFDAHDFIPEVVARGAAGVVVTRQNVPLPPDVAVIKVDDTVKALGMIARAYRDRFSIPLIGITGSAGKTTTKDMLARILSARFKVLKNSGTENNQIGVPQTLLKLRPSHEIAIIEMGTNQFGDIPWLVEVARPTMAILTNIGESHLAHLKTPADVFKEKSALIRSIVGKGPVIINADDRFLKKVPSHERHHRVLTYAIKNAADYKARKICIDQRGRLNFEVNRQKNFVLAVPVPDFVYNALAAITCGRAFNITYNIIQNRLKTFKPHAGRQGLVRLGSYFLIDDSYNANPVSFRCALETLSLLKVRGRRIVVCADMLELGPASEQLHREIGVFAAHKGVAAVFSLGKSSRLIGEAARTERSGIFVFHAESLEDLQEATLLFCQPHDAVLVKGSRGMHMERMAAFLKKQFANQRG